MNENESTNNQIKLLEGLELISKLRVLPEQYFELMNEGSHLAKSGDYAQAIKKFSTARKEIGRIIQQLLEMPKSSSAQMWQTFAVLWTFKMIKSDFYWLLAQSETATTQDARKQFLVAAAGAQLVGHDIVKAFETLDKNLSGYDRELLPLIAEAIRNYEERQRLLEKTLKKHNIDIKLQ